MYKMAMPQNYIKKATYSGTWGLDLKLKIYSFNFRFDKKVCI